MAACCSINMRIFKTTELIFLLFFVVSSCVSAPAEMMESPSSSNESYESNESSESAIHYDQRQNGTENYRVHIDGLAVVVVPVEALLLAGALVDGEESNLFAIPGGIGEKPSKPQDSPILKPQPEADLPEIKPKPEEKPEKQPENIKEKHIHAKSSHKPAIRLMSLLAPFLKRVHAQH